MKLNSGDGGKKKKLFLRGVNFFLQSVEERLCSKAISLKNQYLTVRLNNIIAKDRKMRGKEKSLETALAQITNPLSTSVST